MKKSLSILIPSILLGGLLGCYEDKGNYDYKDINEISFTLTAKDNKGRVLPVGENGICRYKQPSSNDTLIVTYIPEVSQSLRGDDTTNLEWKWKVAYNKNKEEVTDSIYSKELTLVFPPAQSTSYNVIFQLTDLTTNVSHYKRLSVNTVQPYRNSWFVLNGTEGDRYISTIEDPDSTQYLFTKDAYADLGRPRRFQDATGFIYAPSLLGREATLQILAKDSIWMMRPSELKVIASNEQLLPSEIYENNVSLLYGRNGTSNSINTLLLASNNRIYKCWEGNRYESYINNDDPYYKIGMVGEFNEDGSMLAWDGNKNRVLIATSDNELTPYPDERTFSNKIPVWIGASTSPEKEAVGMMLMKDDNGIYYIYDFVSRDKFKEYMLPELEADENSQFAANPALTNLNGQIFYTLDSKLFRLNIKSGETTELYDAEGPISILKFRVNHPHSLADKHDCNCLAMVVNNGNNGELHEVVLTNGGDIETAKTKVFKDFGNIADICFSFIENLK